MTNLVQKRQHKIEKITWLLQIVPFIRFIGLTGSLAYDIAKEESDIDIFIITRQGKIWTCRFFVTAILRLFGLYRTGNLPQQRAGKVCPNRYVTDKYLLINPQNRYHAQDYSQMVPLFDDNAMYRKFLKKNEWMKNYGYFPPRRAQVLIHSGRILSFFRKILNGILSGFLGNWLENYLKNFQLKSILKDPRVNKPDSGLYVDDNELRFHPRPR